MSKKEFKNKKGDIIMSITLLCMIAIVVILFIMGIILLLGVMFDKGKQIYNPIKKDNSDYRFIQVKNEKTRNIFLK